MLHLNPGAGKSWGRGDSLTTAHAPCSSACRAKRRPSTRAPSNAKNTKPFSTRRESYSNPVTDNSAAAEGSSSRSATPSSSSPSVILQTEREPRAPAKRLRRQIWFRRRCLASRQAASVDSTASPRPDDSSEPRVASFRGNPDPRSSVWRQKKAAGPSFPLSRGRIIGESRSIRLDRRRSNGGYRSY